MNRSLVGYFGREVLSAIGFRASLVMGWTCEDSYVDLYHTFACIYRTIYSVSTLFSCVVVAIL